VHLSTKLQLNGIGRRKYRFMDILPRQLAQAATAAPLWLLAWALMLGGCSTTSTSFERPVEGQRIGVLSLLGDQLQVVDAVVGGAERTPALVGIGAWRIDEHVERHARQVIAGDGRFEVVDVDIDGEVARRVYANCDGDCAMQAPELQIEVLRPSLSRWRRDSGLDQLVLFVRSDNRHAVLGPLATSAAGVGLGLIPGPSAADPRATVFAYVEAVVVDAETARVLATSGFFNNGFVDAGVPAPRAGQWPEGSGEVFQRVLRRQLEDGIDAALAQLGLVASGAGSR
jgi:hypothetical protein